MNLRSNPEGLYNSAQTYTGGLDTTVVGDEVTFNGTFQTADSLIQLGAVTLGSDVVLATGTSEGTGGDIILGTVTGQGFSLTLTAGSEANVSGTDVLEVNRLVFGDIGGTVSFDGVLQVMELVVPGTVNAVSLIGDGNQVSAAVVFENTGSLLLGQDAGTQTYAGGLDTTGVVGVVTLNGTSVFRRLPSKATPPSAPG